MSQLSKIKQNIHKRKDKLFNLKKHKKTKWAQYGCMNYFC